MRRGPRRISATISSGESAARLSSTEWQVSVLLPAGRWFLQNRIYLGQTMHKGKIHEGEHGAIV